MEENNNNKKRNVTRYRMICVTDKCVVERTDVSVKRRFVRLVLPFSKEHKPVIQP